jgi:hypothetical protein
MMDNEDDCQHMMHGLLVFQGWVAQLLKDCNRTATGPSGNRTIGCSCPKSEKSGCRLPGFMKFAGPQKNWLQLVATPN